MRTQRPQPRSKTRLRGLQKFLQERNRVHKSLQLKPVRARRKSQHLTDLKSKQHRKRLLNEQKKRRIRLILQLRIMGQSNRKIQKQKKIRHTRLKK